MRAERVQDNRRKEEPAEASLAQGRTPHERELSPIEDDCEDARARDGLRGSAMPQHRRMLGRTEGNRFDNLKRLLCLLPFSAFLLTHELRCSDRDDHADGRYVHERLPLLLGEDERSSASSRS